MFRILFYRCSSRQRACGVLTVLLVLLLAACSGNKATPMPTVAPTSPPPTAASAPTPKALAQPTSQPIPTPLPTTAAAFYGLTQQVKDQQYTAMPDYPSGLLAFPTRKGFDPRGGDAYAINVYERPFSSQTQQNYYPDLDITLATLVAHQDWYILGLRLYGLREGANAPQGDYALEMDLNRDGRGDWLVRVKGPLTAQQWQEKGVEVRRDANGDVEGQQICGSDAPFQGDGYETVVYDGAQQKRGLAWAMWTWEKPDEQSVPLVLLAIHKSVFNAQIEGFLWQAWADSGVRDPQRMVLHDAYTLSQAGEPYTRSPNYPIKAVAEVDSTCRAAFGFEPTGDEPCLCTGEEWFTVATTAETCQIKPPPYDVCMPTAGKPNQWQCYDMAGSEIASAQLIDCTWDPDTCSWKCGEVCEVQTAFENAGCTLQPDGSALCDEAGVPTEYAAEQCTVITSDCTVICSGQQAACDLPNDCELARDNLWKCSDGAWESCTYVDNCTWECSNLLVECQPADLCHPQADGTWACDNGMAFQTCDYDGCWWNCESGGTAPDDDTCQPDDMCTYDDALGMWNCGDEFLWDECTYDGCAWQCENVPWTCASPDACFYDANVGLWLCEDGSLWDLCSYNGCDWLCEGEVQTCEAPNACWEDVDGTWYCDDGSQWATCYYDGCWWICDSNDSAQCELPDACWQDVDGTWYCNDGSQWTTCNYDGCWWYCEGQPSACLPADYCWQNPDNTWSCNDGDQWDDCQYDGCDWVCSVSFGDNDCEADDACWYDANQGLWYCNDGSEWESCEYDGCWWVCSAP